MSPLLLMYDSTDPALIPTTAPVVAGYVDGDYAWSQQDWDRFNCPKVRITINDGALTANVCDVEHGDLTPSLAATWCWHKIHVLSQRPTIYCSLSNVETCKAELTRMNIGLTEVDFWIADYTGRAATNPPSTLYPNSIGHQYIDTGTYDLSVITPTWLVITSQTISNPSPFTLSTVKETTMSIYVAPDGTVYFCAVGADNHAGHIIVGKSKPSGDIQGQWTIMDVTAQNPQFTVQG